MTLLKVIAKLNTLSAIHFPLRTQSRWFTVYCTVSYEQVEKVDLLSILASILYEEEEWTDEEIAQLTTESAIALMASRTRMDRKAKLVHLILRWVTIMKIAPEVTSSIIQSLIVEDIHFNDVYAIRLSVWNYLYKEGLKEGSIITILSSGKIELTPRNIERFNGNAVEQYKFKINEMKAMSRGPQRDWFRAMEKYDYTKFPEGELQEPICEWPIPSGFAAAMAAQPKNYMGSNMSMSEYYQIQIDANKKRYAEAKKFGLKLSENVEVDEKSDSSENEESEEESDSQDDSSSDSGVATDSNNSSITGFDSGATQLVASVAETMSSKVS